MASPSFRVKAVFDYSSPHEDDLSFKLGQIITVTDEEDADWFYGEFDQDGVKSQGLFPRNFVEKYEPTTPPRPTRPARPKKEAENRGSGQEVAQTSSQAALPAAAGNSTSQAEPSLEPETTKNAAKHDNIHEAEAVPPEDPSATDSPADTVAAPAQPAEIKKKPEPPQASSVRATPQQAPAATATGSFKDRIAAFNRPAAPPVAPQKPGNLSQSAGSGFVKKPYVAPPPSRNAYVPPPKDNRYPPTKKMGGTESTAQRQPPSEAVSQETHEERAPEVSEEQPKPTSLKDRIALLQKQQLEQAAKHQEAAQKKEKPKKPPKKSMSQHSEVASPGVGEEGDDAEHMSQEISADVHGSTKPREDGSFGVSAASAPRELLSDTNDADQSAGGDTEDGSDLPSIQRRAHPKQSQEATTPVIPDRAADTLNQGELEADAENAVESGNSSQEEDVDPEVKRRMEIRERMAKMSGGMGMAGMFGPPGGLPGKPPRASKPSGSGNAEADNEKPFHEQTAEGHQPVPVMALPGMSFPSRPKVQSPNADDGLDQQPGLPSFSPRHEASRVSEADENDTDLEEESRGSTGQFIEESEKAPSQPGGRPVPPPPAHSRPSIPVTSPENLNSPPFSPPGNRPVPAPPLPATRPSAVDSESESEDERQAGTGDIETVHEPSMSYRRPPPIPGSPPTQPPNPLSRQTSYTGPKSSAGVLVEDQATPSQSAHAEPSRAPPVPLSAPGATSPPYGRAPPPPPPSQAPLPRRSTDRAMPPTPHRAENVESEEVSEYEGDYDTDIVSAAPRKDALKARDQDSSADETLTGDDSTFHHGGLPSLGPMGMRPPILSSAAPRAVPPPPPSQPPKRQSTEMPRMAPPPPPPPKQESASIGERPEEFPTESSTELGSLPDEGFGGPSSPPSGPRGENYLQAEFPGRSRMSNSRPERQRAPSPTLPPPGRPRQSLEAPSLGVGRPSTDGSRTSGEQGYHARDLDLSRSSQWWMQRRAPPPALQNRSDAVYEVEESVSQNLTVKHVYVLFTDYSQTVITARYNEMEPAQAELSQRHEPPPSQLRQDQLEEVHARFSARLAEMAASKANSVVGNGTPSALLSELLAAIPEALPSVGARSFGAAVYTNMANASVQQHDEIRAGDVVTFRNAKMQGHRGTMKQKYSVDIGKPDHVGIVVDWDGTKKKVRVWEQGRESKKVKMESFKLGDLRSGEVKIWRVVGRDWVGWGR